MEPTPPQHPEQPQAGGDPSGPNQAAAGDPAPPWNNDLVSQRSGWSIPAVLGLILSLPLVLFIPSIVLCIVALVRIRRRAQKGKGLAIAGLVINALLIVGLVTYPFIAERGMVVDRDASGQVTKPVSTRPGKLRVGDCVTSIQEGEVKDVRVQPCDQPNGGKAFAVFNLPPGQWPGLAAVQAAAEKGCADRFKALNQPAAKPSDVLFLYPIEDGWAHGDRGTACLLVPK